MRFVIMICVLLGCSLVCVSLVSPAFADPCKGLHLDEGAQSKVEGLIQGIIEAVEREGALDVLALRDEVRGKLLPLGRLAGTLRASGYVELAVAGKHLKTGHTLLKDATQADDFSAAISEIRTGLSLLHAACPSLP